MKKVRLTENRLRDIIKETIEDYMLMPSMGNDNTTIKIYHRAGMHTDLSLEEVINSICKNGLTTATATDGDGIGKCIWFTKDFDSYGKNGIFVVSMVLTPEKMKKYHISFDGSVAYAYCDIPFSELTIEKMPMFYTEGFGGCYFTNKQKPKHIDSYFDFLLKAASNFKQFQIRMFIDAWDYFGEKYDLQKIKQISNIKVERLIK